MEVASGVVTAAASTGRVLGHRPELDGVRGLAVLIVILFHARGANGQRILPGGYIGVDVFFVLSGFLITCLLVQEYQVRGRIDLGRFWVRRALRLLPALVLLLAVYPLLYCGFHPQDGRI